MSTFSLCAAYATLHGLQGIIIPFFPVWLESKGFGANQVALLLSVTFVCKLISSPLVAHVADVTGRNLLIMSGLLVFALTMYLGYWLVSDQWAILTIAVALGFALPPAYALLDRVTVGDGDKAGGRFGRARLWGSGGFAVATLAMGLLVQRWGPPVILLGMLALLLCGLSIIWLNRARGESRAVPALARSIPVLQLLRHRKLSLIIVGSALVQSSNGFYYSLSTLYWREHGLSSIAIGALWNVGIACEIAFFFFAPRILVRLDAAFLLIASATMTAVRWCILGTTANFAMLLFAQVLQCFTIAGNSIALMESISQFARPAFKATAVAVYTTLAMGIFISASIWAGRLLYVEMSISGFYPMSVISISAVPLFLLALSIREDAEKLLA